MPDLLEAAFRAVPQRYRDWQPTSWEGIPGEHFSALGQVCHVRDIEVEGYHVRIARLLTNAIGLLGHCKTCQPLLQSCNSALKLEPGA